MRISIDRKGRFLENIFVERLWRSLKCEYVYLRAWANVHLDWRRHIGEVFVQINGERLYLWRVINHKGVVLESFVSKRRDRSAALKILRKLLSRHDSPHEIVTDKLGS